MRPASFVAILLASLVAILALPLLREHQPSDPRSPGQIRDEGIAALQAGDFHRAQGLFELSLRKTDTASAGRTVVVTLAAPLFQACALQADLACAERAFSLLHPPGEAAYHDLRAANNYLALLAGSGRMEDGWDVAEKLVVSMRQPESGFGKSGTIAAWTNLDRLIAASGDIGGAQAALERVREQLESLSRSPGARAGGPDPALHAWLARYVSYLRVTGRPDEAQEIAALASSLGAAGAPVDGAPPCVSEADPPPLGCLLEVPVRALAAAIR